ncbi:MAG: DUF4193 family protein [Actinomycetota bacterium]
MAPEITEEIEDDLEGAGEKAATDSTEGETEAEALDELEAEELEMLTEDETTETLVIDEAAEMRAIRRAEISMDVESVDEAASDEFVCTSCFLVKRSSQLANKRKKICRDCAS